MSDEKFLQDCHNAASRGESEGMMSMDDRQFWSKLGIDVDATEASTTDANSPQNSPEKGHAMELLGEEDVTVERLHELFDAAYMECSIDDDGDLKVVTDAGPRVFVSLHDGAKMVRLMALYRFRDDSLEDERLQLVNRMNDDMILIRFSVSESETLVADYYLPYTRGVPAFQIINTVKMMGRIIVSGLRQHDAENLIE